MRRTLLLLISELVQTLRTRENWLFMFGPAALLIPTAVLATQIIVTAMPAPTVALPHDAPMLDAIEARLVDDHINTVRVDDVRSAVIAREARLGLTSIEDLGGRDGVRLRAVIVSRDGGKRLERMVQRSVDKDLLQRVKAAGGTRADIRPARIETLTDDTFLPVDPRDPMVRRIVLGVLLFLALMQAAYLVPLQTISDRDTGVIERLATTGTSLRQLWLARAIAALAVQAFTLVLFTGGLLVMIPPLATEVPLLDLAARLGSMCLAINVLLIWVGLQSPTAVAALTGAPISVLMLVVGVGMFLPMPWWVPLFGPIDAAWAWPLVASVAWTVAVSCAGVVALERWMPVHRLLPQPGSDA